MMFGSDLEHLDSSYMKIDAKRMFWGRMHYFEYRTSDDFFSHEHLIISIIPKIMFGVFQRFHHFVHKKRCKNSCVSYSNAPFRGRELRTEFSSMDTSNLLHYALNDVWKWFGTFWIAIVWKLMQNGYFGAKCIVSEYQTSNEFSHKHTQLSPLDPKWCLTVFWSNWLAKWVCFRLSVLECTILG